jgi:hypothetical protein
MRRQTAEKEQYTPLLSLIWMGDTNRIKYSPAAAPPRIRLLIGPALAYSKDNYFSGY